MAAAMQTKTKVGLISGPFKRRNGYYAEVVVQHAMAPETVTTLWFAKEVRARAFGARAGRAHR